LAFIDPDGTHDTVSATGADECLDLRTGNIDGTAPHPLPELVEAAESGGGPGPRIRRVDRYEHLGQDHELGSRRGGLPDPLDRLGGRGLPAEDHRRGLHGGDPYRSERGHPVTLGSPSIGLAYSYRAAPIEPRRVSLLAQCQEQRCRQRQASYPDCNGADD